MYTIHTTLKPMPMRWAGAVLTAGGVLIAVAAVVLFLAAAGNSRGHHAVIDHPAATYYPSIQYRGTGAPPPSPASTPQTRPVPSAHKSYGAVP